MKPRHRKIITILLAFLVVLIVTLAILIPRVLDLNRYNPLIVSVLEKELGGKVSLGHIRWGITEDIWIEVKGFSVTGNTAFPVDFDIQHLSGEISILPLLFKKVIIEELSLSQPQVVVRLAGKSREETVSSPDNEESSDSEPMFEVMIEELYLKEGGVTLEDSLTFPGQKIVHTFRKAFLEGFDILSREMTFDLSMLDETEAGLGAIKAHAIFTGLTKAYDLEDPKLIIKAKLPSLNVAAVNAYLKESPLAANLEGSLSLEITYESDFGDLLNFNGTLGLTKLTYTDRSLWESPLPLDETTLTYALRFNQDNLSIDEFDIQMGEITLNGQALVQGLSGEPILTDAVMDGELPLIEIIPLVPWAKLSENAGVIRAMLEGGGKVSIEKATLPETNLAKGLDFESVFSGLKVMARLSNLSMNAPEVLPPLEDMGGSIRIENRVLSLEEFSGRLGQIRLPQLTAEITDILGQPEISARIEGRMTFGDISNEMLLNVLRKSGIEKMQGAAEVNLALQLDSARPEAYRLDGTVRLQDFRVKTSYSPASFENLNALIKITPETAEITESSTVVQLPAGEDSSGRSFTVALNGRVDNRRREPIVTLTRMKTSKIMLPWLAPVIPWDTLGESAKIVRESLLAGGELIIEDLSFLKLDSKKLSEDFSSLLQIVSGEFRLADVAFVKVIDWLPGFRKISGRVKLDKGVLIGNDMTIKAGRLFLPDFDFRATGLAGLPKVSLTAKGPLGFEGLEEQTFIERLKQAGLKNLTVDAHADVTGYIDMAKPEAWEISGSLILNKIRTETDTAGVILDNLRGKVSFNRKDSLDVTISELSGRVNQAPFRVSGKLSKIGMPQMLIDIDADAEQLDLRNVASLIGPLKEMGLAGTLDMDMDIYIPYDNPKQTQLKGKAKLADFGVGFSDQKITIMNGNAELALAGDRIQFQDVSLLLNEQKIRLSGQVKSLVEPDIFMEISSPYLDLDRLLPHIREERVAHEKKDKDADKAKSVTSIENKESVDFFRKITAQVKVDVQRGQVQNQEFQPLHVRADYDRGLFKSFEVSMGITEGEILATGTADLRDLAKSEFTVTPDIRHVKIESITPLLGIEKTLAYGPLTLSGNMEGHWGSINELLSSLSGDINFNLGPGRLTSLGPFGNTLAKILSYVNVNVVRVGTLIKDMRGKGMPFHEIKGEASFDGGVSAVKGLFFNSDALDLILSGAVNLLQQEFDMEADVQIFNTLNKAFDLVPVLGTAVSDMAKIHLTLKGPWTNPKIGLDQTRMVTKPVKALLGTPKKALEGLESGDE